MDPLSAVRCVQASVLAARDGTCDEGGLLAALSALRSLREERSGWEPELITAARAAGVSWTALVPALGVASRQAAERRYLRLQPSRTGETTGEARLDAPTGPPRRRPRHSRLAPGTRRGTAGASRTGQRPGGPRHRGAEMPHPAQRSSRL
ncbi:HSP18 transcriptional regulator [Amycolatopsis sp. H20-H5]|uniref:HSP18 transcriptional regulator n=1 Tax=Amycolatopsis sp. H20-H5 TaxID=3046309 RepID=UPI002DC02CBF|nr:HSP18 transcriptional regulator [Amycolatopsis sp. H20-H5]MEC3982011.1 HSP18 transcriptional regulator [Amycolatopsis sp. H20-H5]